MSEWEKWETREVLKLRVPESLLIEALSITSGYCKDKIKDLLRKTGDIGDTAELILMKKKQKRLLDG